GGSVEIDPDVSGDAATQDVFRAVYEKGHRPIVGRDVLHAQRHTGVQAALAEVLEERRLLTEDASNAPCCADLHLAQRYVMQVGKLALGSRDRVAMRACRRVPEKRRETIGNLV